MSMNREDEKLKEQLSEVILKSWQDPELKLRLIEDPKGVCKEYGIEVEGGADVVFHLDSAAVKHFTIPMNPADYMDSQVQEDVAKIARKHVEVACTVSWTGGSHRTDMV